MGTRIKSGMQGDAGWVLPPAVARVQHTVQVKVCGRRPFREVKEEEKPENPRQDALRAMPWTVNGGTQQTRRGPQRGGSACFARLAAVGLHPLAEAPRAKNIADDTNGTSGCHPVNGLDNIAFCDQQEYS